MNHFAVPALSAELKPSNAQLLWISWPARWLHEPCATGRAL